MNMVFEFVVLEFLVCHLVTFCFVGKLGIEKDTTENYIGLKKLKLKTFFGRKNIYIFYFLFDELKYYSLVSKN